MTWLHEKLLFCKTLRCHAEKVSHENYDFNANKYIPFKKLNTLHFSQFSGRTRLSDKLSTSNVSVGYLIDQYVSYICYLCSIGFFLDKIVMTSPAMLNSVVTVE